MPGDDHPVEVQNLRLEHPQLGTKSGKTCTRYLGQSLVTSIGNHMKQFLHAMAPNRCNNTKLGHMSADRVDHRSLLTDQKMPRAMEHQATLLLSCLGRHKPHVS